MQAKPTEEVVHSQGRVMADRSVLFKYINPNLAFVLAEGQDSSGKGFVNIYLLDLVTGRIIFSANHRYVLTYKILLTRKDLQWLTKKLVVWAYFQLGNLSS